MVLSGHVVALCGGVGGAKLAFGLTRLLPPERLSIICNTGDDFEHFGLHISPDIDTVLYTLAELSDRGRGWGLADETWNFMAQVAKLGGPQWFNLGDKDMAMHVERTRRLRDGATLTSFTVEVAKALGIEHTVLPMSDDVVRTRLRTPSGDLAFQEYFVREHCEPPVSAIWFEGSDSSRPSAEVSALLDRDDIAAVIICPSNPYLSIDPILAVPSMVERLALLDAPTIAVSPLIGGTAVKGPLSKLMRELAIEPDSMSVARHYEKLLNALVIDQRDSIDAAVLSEAGLEVHVTATLMQNDADRIRLAGEVLNLAARIAFAS